MCNNDLVIDDNGEKTQGEQADEMIVGLEKHFKLEPLTGGVREMTLNMIANLAVRDMALTTMGVDTASRKRLFDTAGELFAAKDMEVLAKRAGEQPC